MYTYKYIGVLIRDLVLHLLLKKNKQTALQSVKAELDEQSDLRTRLPLC